MEQQESSKQMAIGFLEWAHKNKYHKSQIDGYWFELGNYANRMPNENLYDKFHAETIEYINRITLIAAEKTMKENILPPL